MDGCYVFNLIGVNKNYLNECNPIKFEKRMEKVILII